MYTCVVHVFTLANRIQCKMVIFLNAIVARLLKINFAAIVRPCIKIITACCMDWWSDQDR